LKWRLKGRSPEILRRQAGIQVEAMEKAADLPESINPENFHSSILRHLISSPNSSAAFYEYMNQ